MHWKLKAKIQNTVAHLPDSASYAMYYWIQRHFGGLRNFNPTIGLMAGIETWKLIQSQNQSPVGKTFLEVGTGRVPLVPLAYWLMGAESIITLDKNLYLKEDLIADSIRYMSDNEEEIRNLFGSLMDVDRFTFLLDYVKQPNFSAIELLELCQINYISPGDASNTHLPDKI